MIVEEIMKRLVENNYLEDVDVTTIIDDIDLFPIKEWYINKCNNIIV